MRQLVSVVLTGVLLTACKGADALSPEDVSGVFLLETINGNPLPFTRTQTQNGVSVTTTSTAGSLSLNADGTYGLSIDISGMIGSDTTTITLTVTEFGTFELLASSGSSFHSNASRV